MISYSQVSNNRTLATNLQDSVFIKFGKVHYQIFRNQIACLYKTEGVFFLIDKRKLKLPLFMNRIEEFPLSLSGNQFFRLSETVIVNKTAVRISEGLDRDVAVASNSIYTNKFLIPESKKDSFRRWLRQSES